MIHHALNWLVVLALAVGASAQTTWIVDPDNGPGTDFTDLQPAVDAAAPGDRIHLVQRSSTSNFIHGAVINKPLAIIGGINPFSGPGIPGATEVIGRIEVRDIPAGTRCLLSSIAASRNGLTAGTPYGMHVHNCAGQVHLERCYHSFGTLSGGLMLFEDCADLSFQGDNGLLGIVLTAPGAAITFRRSNVTITSCFMDNFGVDPPSGPPFWVATQSPTIAIEDSHVRLVSTIVSGAAEESIAWWGGPFAATPAIELQSGTLEIGPDCFLYGGTRLNGASSTAVRALGGTLLLDPRVTHTGLSGIAPSTVTMAALTRGQVVRNEPFRVRLYGQANGLGILVAGGASLQPVPTPFGPVGLDPAWASTLAVAPLDATGVVDLTFSTSPALPMNYLFALQAAMLAPNGAIALTGVNRMSVQWQAGVMP